MSLTGRFQFDVRFQLLNKREIFSAFKLKQDEIAVIFGGVMFADAGSQVAHIRYDPNPYIPTRATADPQLVGLGSNDWFTDTQRLTSLAAGEPIFFQHTPIPITKQIAISTTAGTWDIVFDYTAVKGNMVDPDRLSELAKKIMVREPPAGETGFTMNKRQLMGDRE